MIKKTWQEILKEHTRYFRFGRYDILATNQVVTDIASVMTADHQMKNENYRSYGTYRHDICVDTSLIKINETTIPEKNILNYYYNKDDNNYNNYIFSGIVLAKSYAVNGNEITLEDLFAEYGYDYIKALDQQRLENGEHTFYFEEPKENDENFIPWTYQILPSGIIFEDKEDLDNEGKPKTSVINYDGTYCPTVAEIIDGSLYIVMQSGTQYPRKIYFNNTYLPSLFINDDKYPTNLEAYILGNQQTLKLCDVTLFERIGVEILWQQLIKITNLGEFTQNIKNQLSEEDINKIRYKLYYHVKYKVHNSNLADVYLISGLSVLSPATGVLDNQTNIITDAIDNGNEVDFLDPAFSNVPKTTGKVYIGKLTNDNDNPIVTIDFSMGISLMLEGYSLTYVDTTERFKLHWYQYTNDNTTYNIDIGMQFNSFNNIKINGQNGQNTRFTIGNYNNGSTINLEIIFTESIEYHQQYIFSFLVNNDPDEDFILIPDIETNYYIKKDDIDIFTVNIINSGYYRNISITALQNITESFNEFLELGTFSYTDDNHNILYLVNLNLKYENS